MTSQVFPPQPVAPPTSPLPLPEKQPTWIMVIGVISIILGAGGVLTNCVNAFSCFAMGLAPNTFNATPGTAGMTDSFARWGPLLGTLGVLSLLVSGLLLWAGIAMVRRRRITVRLHYVWCAARAIMGIVSAVVGMLYAREIMKAQELMMQSAGGPSPAFLGGFMQAVGWLSLVFGVVWALAYPIFIVIWLARERVRRDVERWMG